MFSKKYIDPFSDTVKKMSQQFDNATINRDTKQLYDLIYEATELVNNEDTASQSQLYYSIATVYGDINNINGTSDGELIKKQLYYFRKSIELIKAEELTDSRYLPYVNALKLNLYTNYGNTLDHCGRKIAAIEQYRKALSIRDTFGMALGNLGIAYRHYGMLVYDPAHRDYFHHFAYNLLNRAMKIEDPNTHNDAKMIFKRNIDGYDTEYIKHVLSVPLDIPQYSYCKQDELEYRRWALENSLFLNPLNDLPVYEFCFAADVLHLPSIITKIDYKPVFHGMFNQFKQEYIFARYQYYRSLQEHEVVHFADKDTYLLNFPDYPQYSIRIEMLKSAFKTLYSLLDKVAYFMNSYFKLGIKERDVSFHSIWNCEKRGKNGYKYENILNPNENFSLASIYWISKDFYEKFIDSPNPQAQRIRNIRNALEHKYVKVIWGLSPDRTTGDIDDLAFYVPEVELSTETFRLLKLIREIIICLSLAVGIEEENRKHKLDPSKVVMPITLMDYDDEWKR